MGIQTRPTKPRLHLHLHAQIDIVVPPLNHATGSENRKITLTCCYKIFDLHVEHNARQLMRTNLDVYQSCLVVLQVVSYVLSSRPACQCEQRPIVSTLLRYISLSTVCSRFSKARLIANAVKADRSRHHKAFTRNWDRNRLVLMRWRRMGSQRDSCRFKVKL